MPPERKGGGGLDSAWDREHVHAGHSDTQVLMWYICALIFKYGCNRVVLRFIREKTIYFQPGPYFHSVCQHGHVSCIKFHPLLHCKIWRSSCKMQWVHINSAGAKKPLKHVHSNETWLVCVYTVALRMLVWLAFVHWQIDQSKLMV